MEFNGDIAVQVLALMTLVVPLLVQYFAKRSNLQRGRHVVELLKTRDELDEVIDQYQQKGSTDLTGRLTELRTRVDEDIESSIRTPRVNVYQLIILGESYFGFQLLLLVLENFSEQKEGIMETDIAWMFFWAIIVCMSAGLTFALAKNVKRRIHNYLVYNVGMIVIFNLIVLGSSGGALGMMRLLDRFTKQF